MIKQRTDCMEHIFKNKNDDDVYSPVAFQFMIDNIKNQMYIQSNSKSDITPLELYELIENTYETLEQSRYINRIYYLKHYIISIYRQKNY